MYISRTCSTDMFGLGSGSGCPSKTNSRSSLVTVTGMVGLPPRRWLLIDHSVVPRCQKLPENQCSVSRRPQAVLLKDLSTTAARFHPLACHLPWPSDLLSVPS